MAEAVGLAASLISLASLFSTCIECFGYYRAAKNCPREVKTKLVKLDFEKTRLLIWANEVGLVSTEAQFRNLGLDQHEDQIRTTLQEIEALLSEANKMEDRYGVRQQDERVVVIDSTTDLISRNSFDTFMASFRRFRGKYLSLDPGSKIRARFRWAIADESKFEVLIKTLRNFVDNLFWLVEVERSVLDHIVEQDIMAITELLDLEMIKDASEYEYRVWSDIASRAVDRTERGTVPYSDATDERRYDEETRRVGELPKFPRERAIAEIYRDAWGGSRPPACFVLTDSCQSFSDPPPCVDNDFGYRLLWPTFKKISYHATFHQNAMSDLGLRLSKQFNSSTWTREDVQNFLRQVATKPANRGFQFLGSAYIYVAPCERLIAQALCICMEMDRGISRYFSHLIRVDDRCGVSCCQPDKGYDRLVSLRSYCTKAADSGLVHFLDKLWLEQRIYELEEEGQRSISFPDPAIKLKHCYEEEAYSMFETLAAIVMVGEEDEVREVMASKSFPRHPRVPKATEIYAMHHKNRNATITRQYLGTYRRNPPLVWRKDLMLETQAEDTNSLPNNLVRSISPTGAGPSPKRRKISNEQSDDYQELQSLLGGSQTSQPSEASISSAHEADREELAL